MLETIFSLCGGLAMLGWAALILAPRVAVLRDMIVRVLIPAIIGIVYIGLMLSTNTPEGGGFGSLAEVKTLFSVCALLLAGWIHYLAFDLFVGAWEVGDARGEGIHHLLLVPCLLLTFMLGPAGLLLYFSVKYSRRALVRKQLAGEKT